jgi:hypothetical protein|uniref:Uncharacterized protein n=1 Tax=Picea glauca TaxID=3330 RepID=A0A117NIG0_PICGL|nr:hypothetical protein ABT39_MTgene3092 [Picea glauca]
MGNGPVVYKSLCMRKWVIDKEGIMRVMDYIHKFLEFYVVLSGVYKVGISGVPIC